MAEPVAAFAPGRVNLIGEHTDYNDGLALPFAIELGVTVVAERSTGATIEAYAVDLDETDSFPVAAPPPATGWRAFVRGAVAELAAAGCPVPPARVEIAGTVPIGSGLSSSAAVEVALTLAFLGLAGRSADPVELARLCSRVENDWVGAETGLLDQLSSLLCRADEALRIDFRSLATQPVPLHLGDWTLSTVDSGTPHSLDAAEGYNTRRAECRKALSLLGIDSMRDATPDGLPDPLARRVRHVLDENARVDATVAALSAGDLLEVGPLLDASHASLRDLYEVSTPAVEDTVKRLRAAGAAGARLVGGGFGGHVLALFPPGVQPPPDALRVTPSAGARLLD